MIDPYEQIEAFQKLPYIVLKHDGAMDTKPKETE